MAAATDAVLIEPTARRFREARIASVAHLRALPLRSEKRYGAIRTPIAVRAGSVLPVGTRFATSVLATEDLMGPTQLTIAWKTDIGLLRSKNEDALLVTDFVSSSRESDREPEAVRCSVGPKGVLVLVSDGMGGARAGQVASALVVEEVARAMKGAPAGTAPDVALNHAVAKAHAAVADAARAEARRGMGATMTAVHVVGSAAYVAEVGDSRAYLLRGGSILQLTEDQNLANLLVDAGSLDVADAPSSYMSNVLSQSMGHRTVLPALGKLTLCNRDCLLVCSDGLTRLVRDDEIADIVVGSRTLDDACERLVALANERGGVDNITVVLAGVRGELAEASACAKLSDSYEVLQSYVPTAPVAPGSGTRVVPAEVKLVH